MIRKSCLFLCTWSLPKIIPGIGFDIAYSMCLTDALGLGYVTGIYSGTIVVANETLPTAVGYDILLIQMSLGGALPAFLSLSPTMQPTPSPFLSPTVQPSGMPTPTSLSCVEGAITNMTGFFSQCADANGCCMLSSDTSSTTSTNGACATACITSNPACYACTYDANSKRCRFLVGEGYKPSCISV